MKPPPAAEPLRLLLAEQPRVRLASGATLDLAPSDAALLCLLAVEGPQPRARLAGLLWPEGGDESARNRLRQRLFHLRRSCGHPLVEGRATLHLSPEVGHDLAEGSGLLGALAFPDFPAFEPWLAAQRQARAVGQRARLEAQAEALEAARDYGAAVVAAEALLALDPLSEAAHRRLMRLHYLRGDRAAALLAFDRCAQVLKDEVGAQPTAQTLQLLQSLQRAEAPALPVPFAQVPASVLRPPRTVGRDAVREGLRRDLAAGAVPVLVGEAGMGKSRVLADLAAQLGPVAGAAARPGDAAVPFSSLGRLLRQLPGAGPPPRGEGDFETALQAWIDRHCATLACVMVDDLHFADEASLDTLQALATRPAAQGVRWLFALRPAEATSRAQALLDGLAESGRLAMTALQPLRPQDLAALVDSLDLPGLDGATLGPALHRQCGGSPLYALETLKQMLLAPPGAAAEGALALPRPASVLALIERRLARLSPAALAVARAAAITGADFTLAIAEAVLELPALRLADAWQELAAAQVLRDSAFAHDLVFEAVLRSVPPEIARHTHARVARVLGEQGSDAARVADHWLRAGRREEALPWLKAAAAAAGQARRPREQTDFLLRAADCEEALGRPADAFATLDHALTGIDTKVGLSLDLAASERLLALAPTPALRLHAGKVRLRQRLLLHRFGEVAAEGPALLQAAAELGDEATRGEVSYLMGTALAVSGQGEEGSRLMLAAEAWMQATGSLERQMEYHGNLGAVLDILGRPREAQRHHRFAIDSSRSVGQPSQLANGFTNLGFCLHLGGRVEDAVAALLEAERLYAEVEGEMPPYAAASLAACARAAGRFREALDWAATGLARAGPQLSPNVAASALLREAMVWTDLGQYARAEALLDRLAAEEAAGERARAWALLERARAQRWRGEDPQPALERAAALAPASQRALALALEIERMRGLPPLQALAASERVIEEARRSGLEGHEMAAWAQRAAGLAPHDAALAAEAARRVLAFAPGVLPTPMYAPEAQLAVARALQAAGEAEAAAAVVRRAGEWLNAALAGGQVPAAFVSSFLHRNPVNVALREWAARLGLPVANDSLTTGS